MDESSIDLLRNSDINNVFVEINQIRRDQCLEEINIDKNATIDMLPQEFRTQVNSEQYEFLIKEFMKSEKIVNFSSDKISLISLPQKANQPINNQPLLKILISTLLIFLTLLSINLSKLIIRNLS